MIKSAGRPGAGGGKHHTCLPLSTLTGSSPPAVRKFLHFSSKDIDQKNIPRAFPVRYINYENIRRKLFAYAIGMT